MTIRDTWIQNVLIEYSVDCMEETSFFYFANLQFRHIPNNLHFMGCIILRSILVFLTCYSQFSWLAIWTTSWCFRGCQLDQFSESLSWFGGCQEASNSCLRKRLLLRCFQHAMILSEPCRCSFLQLDLYTMGSAGFGQLLVKLLLHRSSGFDLQQVSFTRSF